jgi:alpha-galactosidase
MPPARAAMLRKLLPPTGVAAEFEDQTLSVGIVRLQNARMFCVFNWDDTPRTRVVRLGGAAMVVDFWTDASLGRRDVLSLEMPPRSARLLRVTQ